MIRAGITGGTAAAAGEIIKLLVNHPDVEIIWVEAPEAEGAFIHQIHKGLRGETYMRFCSRYKRIVPLPDNSTGSPPLPYRTADS